MKIDVTDYIGIGHENSITREDLCKLTNLTDREVRECISVARRNVPILNLQDGCGYFVPTKKEVAYLRKYIRQETKRAKSIFWSMRAARRELKKLGE